MRLRRLVPAPLIAAVLAGLGGPAHASPPEPAPAAEGAVEVAAVVQLPSGHYAVRRARAASAREGQALAARWRTEAAVVDAGLDVPVQASADPEQSRQWGLPAVRATEAWAAGSAAGQVVAVVDSGVDLGHPDLAPVLLRGYDVVDGDTVPDDANGHGTHVAGVVGAVAGNGIGGAGVAQQVRLLPVRVLGADGGGTASSVAAGVRWAADNGATVVNLSLGSPTSSSLLANAVTYALDKGITVVAATGNEGSSTPSWPAAQAGVLAVGAVDQSRALAPFSNRGAHVGLVAPGVGIVSTLPGGTYGAMSGTSTAAPFVAGAAAVVRATQRLTGPAVTDALTRVAVDLGPAGRDDAFGHGLLDARAALGRGGPPFGSLDGVGGLPGGVRVSGWAIDPDTAASVDVHVYVGGAGHAVLASGSRPDVGAAYPAYGAQHGYDAVLPAAPGTWSVCAYALDVGGPGNSRLGCRTVVVPGGSPFGSLDGVSGVPGGVRVSGWVIDPDTAASVDVHAYVGGTGHALRASRSRPDVGAAHPGYGADHGYDTVLPAAPGTWSVCAYGIDVGVGDHTALGCRTVVVPGGSPFGSLDGVSAVPGGVRVAGWVIDPDTAAPVDVHAYVGAAGHAVRAASPRTDVGAAFPAYGAQHGFDAVLPAAPGTWSVCVYAIDVGVGDNSVLGCRSVVVR